VQHGGVFVSDALTGQTKWLEVIGKALTYLCLQQAEAKSPGDFDTVLKKVEFLEGLGMDQADAAVVAGSSPASVNELRRLERNSKNGKSKGKAKNKGRGK
jgi:hypothetical protein